MKFYLTEEELDSYAEFVRSRAKQTGIYELDVNHAVVLGIVGEYFEVLELEEEMESTTDSLDLNALQEKLKKEHGDMLFYFRMAFNLLTITNSRIMYNIDSDVPFRYVKFSKAMEELIDMYKRRYVYQQQRVPLEQTVVDAWYTFCDDLAQEHGDEYLRDCLVTNEAKLTKRHPNGFTTETSFAKRDEL